METIIAAIIGASTTLGVARVTYGAKINEVVRMLKEDLPRGHTDLSKEHTQLSKNQDESMQDTRKLLMEQARIQDGVKLIAAVTSDLQKASLQEQAIRGLFSPKELELRDMLQRIENTLKENTELRSEIKQIKEQNANLQEQVNNLKSQIQQPSATLEKTNLFPRGDELER